MIANDYAGRVLTRSQFVSDVLDRVEATSRNDFVNNNEGNATAILRDNQRHLAGVGEFFVVDDPEVGVQSFNLYTDAVAFVNRRRRLRAKELEGGGWE